ncbi:MAG: RDD family protein [Acidobacteriota bacterium]
MSDRFRLVTNEPRLVADELLDQVLASPPRRLTAFVIDLLLFVLVGTPLLVAATAISLELSAPGAIGYLRDADEAVDEAERRRLFRQFGESMILLLIERRPAIVPAEVKRIVEEGSREELLRRIDELDWSLEIGFELGGGETSWDAETGRVVIRQDLVLGRWQVLLGVGPFFLGWFTLWPWLLRGRTPGKLTCRIAVRRADGQRLSLWDCFGRAGGYSASASTLGLGFLELCWDPNRQAAHDRISGTLVIDLRHWVDRRRPRVEPSTDLSSREEGAEPQGAPERDGVDDE